MLGRPAVCWHLGACGWGHVSSGLLALGPFLGMSDVRWFTDVGPWPFGAGKGLGPLVFPLFLLAGVAASAASPAGHVSGLAVGLVASAGPLPVALLKASSQSVARVLGTWRRPAVCWPRLVVRGGAATGSKWPGRPPPGAAGFRSGFAAHAAAGGDTRALRLSRGPFRPPWRSIVVRWLGNAALGAWAWLASASALAGLPSLARGSLGSSYGSRQRKTRCHTMALSLRWCAQCMRNLMYLHLHAADKKKRRRRERERYIYIYTH